MTRREGGREGGGGCTDSRLRRMRLNRSSMSLCMFLATGQKTRMPSRTRVRITRAWSTHDRMSTKWRWLSAFCWWYRRHVVLQLPEAAPHVASSTSDLTMPGCWDGNPGARGHKHKGNQPSEAGPTPTIPPVMGMPRSSVTLPPILHSAAAGRDASPTSASASAIQVLVKGAVPGHAVLRQREG